MSAYSQDEQEKIQAQGFVREWHRSGFLEAAQASGLEAELRVDLRRTNAFFRAILFVFTTLIIGASTGFVFVFFHLDGHAAIATLCSIGAAVSFVMATLLISKFRLYRFGVEEALAFASIVFITIAVGAIFETSDLPIKAVLLTASAASLAAYFWFGYVEAAVISMVCAAMIPFDTSFSNEWKRLLAAAVCAVVFIVVRRLRLRHTDDFPGNQYAILQAAAWAALYIALNFQFYWLSYAHSPIYWFTYGMIFVLPIIGARLALRDRDRLLLLVTLGMALATLMTNKPYLGMERKPWDPILFGLFLMATAIVIKRWLSSGPDGERYGFTPRRLLAGDRRIMTLVGTASAALQPGMPSHSHSPEPAKPDFGGGRSGGAGADGSF